MNKFIGLAAAVVTLAVVPANAVTVTSIDANFSNPVGGSNISYQNLDGHPGNEVFNWGNPATSNGSNSFTFASTATPINVAANTQFSLGTFSYNNQPTTGTALTSLQLSLATMISGSPSTSNFLFGLGVDETTNSPPCPYPSTTPCSDRVTVSVLNGTGSFMSGGTLYTLYIDGFKDSGGNFSTNFIGQENTTTTATVIGRFAAAVPEPASWAMMVGGFGLIGGALRRRRSLGISYS